MSSRYANLHSMEFRQLGRSGIEVSRICFGGWQVAGFSSTSDQNFSSTLHAALDQGVNFIDTSEIYGNGHSEALVAKFVSGIRKQVVIATKFSHRNATPQAVRTALESSLRRLRTDYIDLYLYHWPSKTVPLKDTLDAMQLLKKEGKIRAIGVSNWMEPEWEEYGGCEGIDALQPCYSLLWRTVEKSVLQLCRVNSLAVLCYSPLCQGILSGRYKQPSDIPHDPRQDNLFFKADEFPKVLEFLGELNEVASQCGRTTVQVALRWLLDTPGVTSVVVGSSTPQQILDNLGALHWSLSSEQYKLLGALSLPFSNERAPHDTLFGWHSRS